MATKCVTLDDFFCAGPQRFGANPKLPSSLSSLFTKDPLPRRSVSYSSFRLRATYLPFFSPLNPVKIKPQMLRT